jgi:hypothetical protein
MFEQPEAPPTVLDALGSPADVAAWAATAPPGADVVGPPSVIEPSTVDGAAQIDLLIALERQIAWLTARQQQVLATLDGRALDWQGKQTIDYTQEQVGAALRLSPGTPLTGSRSDAPWWINCRPPWGCSTAGRSPTCTPSA